MSIPTRLWRILRGRLIQVRERGDPAMSEAENQLDRVRERLDQARANADAAHELGGDLASRRPRSAAPETGIDQRPTTNDQRAPTGTRSDSAASTTGPAHRSGPRDPFAEEWRLLQVAPGSTLDAVEAAYQARLAETSPERFPEGSPERAGAERRTAALTAAYERLRDTLNTTETRFEKLEF